MPVAQNHASACCSWNGLSLHDLPSSQQTSSSPVGFCCSKPGAPPWWAEHRRESSSTVIPQCCVSEPRAQRGISGAQPLLPPGQMVSRPRGRGTQSRAALTVSVNTASACKQAKSAAWVNMPTVYVHPTVYSGTLMNRVCCLRTEQSLGQSSFFS